MRRQGHSPEDAQDLTQAFFTRLIEKKFLATAQRERGKFRWFLLTSLRHFLANEWDRARAKKRGGLVQFIPWNETAAEAQYRAEPLHETDAEKLYERSWALTLLEQARASLRAEFAASGKAERFDLLEKFLPGEEPNMTYADAGRELGVAEGTVKSDVHRLKRRYREFVRQEVAHTVADPSAIEDELRVLFVAVSR